LTKSGAIEKKFCYNFLYSLKCILLHRFCILNQGVVLMLMNRGEITTVLSFKFQGTWGKRNGNAIPFGQNHSLIFFALSNPTRLQTSWDLSCHARSFGRTINIPSPKDRHAYEASHTAAMWRKIASFLYGITLVINALRDVIRNEENLTRRYIYL